MHSISPERSIANKDVRRGDRFLISDGKSPGCDSNISGLGAFVDFLALVAPVSSFGGLSGTITPRQAALIRQITVHD
jgi:hypothetical protein